VLSLTQIALAYETGTELVKKKLEDPSLDAARSLNEGDNGVYKLAKVRPQSLKDSGRGEALMFIENTNFRFVGDIGFYVPRLAVSLKPNNPALPVVFDDPLSFSIHVHRGNVILSGTALTALFNDYVFKFAGAPLKELKLSTAPGVLTLAGKLYRGKWIPFVMKGNVTTRDGHILLYEPDRVEVDGADATMLLPAANVKLDELLKVDAPGAKLVGSTIVLDALKLFPPPKLQFRIKSVSLESNGLVLEFDDGRALEFAKPFAASSSHMLVRGGDVKFLRTMPLNVSLQINNIESGKDLDFCLYRYRDQLVRGHFTVTEKGEIHAFFPNPSCAYQKESEP
jgi:hypothetical protein